MKVSECCVHWIHLTLRIRVERRLFLVAALQELSGKEKQLATDPECSNILERMMYSMDDFVKRIFADCLADRKSVV